MKFLLAALALTTSLAVSAQTKIVSVDAFDLSYTGALIFKHDNGEGPDRDETKFRFNLNFAQNIEQYPNLMWKARVFFNRSDVDMGRFDSIESAFGGALGALYNFNPEKIKDSLFVGGLVGVERATYEANGLDDESGFNLFLDLEAGKRWDLGTYSIANISYAPTVGLNWKRYGGDIRDRYYKSGYELKFNFLKFDILF